MMFRVTSIQPSPEPMCSKVTCGTTTITITPHDTPLIVDHSTHGGVAHQGICHRIEMGHAVDPFSACEAEHLIETVTLVDAGLLSGNPFASRSLASDLLIKSNSCLHRPN